MPFRSKAQSRYAHWVDEHPAEAAREHGMTPAVASEFIEAGHGHSLKTLPERVQHKAQGGPVRAFPKRFAW